MIKIFVDSDIIIDLLAKREHYLAAARLLAVIRKKKVQAYTTPIVLANVDYIITKHANREKSKKAIRTLRKSIGILPMDGIIVDNALDSSFADFEDALQYFAAEAQQMDFIVTRNKKDYKNGKTKAVNAEEFLNLHIVGEDLEV